MANKSLWYAIGGAVVLAFLTDAYPRLGGAILVLIVLGMLLNASRKGIV